MSKYLIMLALPLLLLSGCAGTALADDGKGNVTAALPGNGTALVKVQIVVSGCGIEPPDGDSSRCGVHSITPKAGKFNATAYPLSSISPSGNAVTGQVFKASVEANASGEFLLDLPPGSYYSIMINDGYDSGSSRNFTISSGKATDVGIIFHLYLP